MKQENFSLLQNYINRYRDLNGIAPTLKEISHDTGIPFQTVSKYLRRMKELGLIEYQGYRKMKTQQDMKFQAASYRVPKVGSISCGLPKLAEQDIESYIPLPKAWLGTGTFFILVADGRSMQNAGIDSGDFIVIRKQETAEFGQIIVALVDDEEATLKRYKPHPENNTVELVPENDTFPTKTVDLMTQRFSIQGVVVGVYKNYERQG